MTKPTTIDGRPVLWHSAVPEKATYGDDPDEVAVVEVGEDCGGVMICGLYHGEWKINSGNRAAVRLLLAEVDRMKAQLAKALAFAEAHERWEAAVILHDAAWDTFDGLPKLSQSLYDQAIEVQRLRNAFCHELRRESSPEAAREVRETRTDIR